MKQKISKRINYSETDIFVDLDALLDPLSEKHCVIFHLIFFKIEFNISMSKFSNDKYRELVEIFSLGQKRVLKRELSRNKSKHIEYTSYLVESYNNLTKYINEFYDIFDEDNKEQLKRTWYNSRDKLNLCFSKILTTFSVPTELREQLNLRDILRNNFTEKELRDFELATALPFKDPDSESLNSETSRASSSEHLNNIENITVSNMAQAMSSQDFLNLAAKTINHIYDGDPLALPAFINSIELLNDFASEAIQPMFCRFIKSKLKGKAFECIPTDATTPQHIIDALKKDIKPDNSKVIAGRILALKPDRSKLTEFSKNAEDLAEAFQRSLIIEGISQTKAREMAIEKTIEVCRNAARSDLVKSVLASSRFESPKEVVAKYVVENATESNERQIIAYKRFNSHNNRSNNNNRGNYRVNNNRFNNRGNFQHNNRGNSRNYTNNRGNFNNNNRGNRYNNNRRNNNFNNNNNQNNNGNNNRYNNIRYAGNEEAPQFV